jgi:hypothetical protein
LIIIAITQPGSRKRTAYSIYLAVPPRHFFSRFSQVSTATHASLAYQAVRRRTQFREPHISDMPRQAAAIFDIIYSEIIISVFCEF